MDNLNIETLNSEFAIDKVVLFDEKSNGQIVVKINNVHAEAEIMLQGAHLIHWQPVNEQPVIWLSTEAKFAQGKSIRGGAPVCWPWFGAHAENSSLPAHGHARTVPWKPVNVAQLTDGSTQLTFQLIENDETKKLWPYNTELEIQFVIGQSLQIKLLTKNTDNKKIEISEALHTYFNVGDIRKASIKGLESCRYLDKTDNFSVNQQTGAVFIEAEVDRIYTDTIAAVSIEDPVLNRRILINKDGSQSTVVWNPWKTIADKMGDLGEDGYLNMVCVESANAANNTISIEAGETHCLTVNYSVELLKID